jgi:hypothetical protein
MNNVAIKPKTAIGTETIAAISLADRPDFEGGIDVDIGLEVEVGVGLLVEVEVGLAPVDTPEPGVANGTGALHQLHSCKLIINLPVVGVELDASLSLVDVASVTSPTQ